MPALWLHPNLFHPPVLCDIESNAGFCRRTWKDTDEKVSYRQSVEALRCQAKELKFSEGSTKSLNIFA